MTLRRWISAADESDAHARGLGLVEPPWNDECREPGERDGRSVDEIGDPKKSSGHYKVSIRHF